MRAEGDSHFEQILAAIANLHISTCSNMFRARTTGSAISSVVAVDVGG